MNRSPPPSITSPLAAILTPRGRGAVASIRVTGSPDFLDRQALFCAADGRRVAQQPIGRIVFGHWGQATVEEVVVCRHDAATTEIHCHGGDAAVERIVSELEGAGCRIVSWSDLAADRLGLLAAECLQTLSRATTLRTADILLEQSSGALQRAIESIGAARDIGEARLEIEGLLDRAPFGLHLTRPWQVVLTGRPNVGKSSLVNALLGYARSIVSDEAGTTRDVVTGETAFDGWPVQLADTAGIRPDPAEIEALGIARARSRLEQADCRVVLVDLGEVPQAEDFELLNAWPDAIRVGHKSDRPDRWGAALPEMALRVSSLTDAGVAQLAEVILARLVPVVPPPGTAVPVTERQVALLREAHEVAVRGEDEVVQRCVQQLLRG